MQKRGLWILTLLALLPLTSCTNKGNSENVDVLLLAGQSNMEGWSYSEYLDSSLRDEFSNGYSDIKISYENANVSSSSFTNVSLGQGVISSCFGPELGIAKRFHEEKAGKKLFLIKYAIGGSSLASDWLPLSSDSSLFAKMVAFAKSSLESLSKDGYSPRLSAFLWMQGESDTLSIEEAEAYKENEINLISSLREKLGSYSDSKIAFVDTGISSSPIWTYSDKVNEAKKEIAELDSDNVYFSSIENNLSYSKEPTDSPDLRHFDAESELKLGEIFLDESLPYMVVSK